MASQPAAGSHRQRRRCALVHSQCVQSSCRHGHRRKGASSACNNEAPPVSSWLMVCTDSPLLLAHTLDNNTNCR